MGEEATGVIVEFSWKAEPRIHFPGSFGCGTPFVVVFTEFSVLVEGPMVVP